MKTINVTLIFVFFLFSCEKENPAEYANDYTQGDMAFHRIVKESFAEPEITEELVAEDGIFEELIEVPPAQQAGPPAQAQAAEGEGQKLIKTADVIMQVGDMEKSSGSLDSLISLYEAYIGQDDFQNSPSRKHRTLAIRVPSGNLDDMVNSVTEIGEFISRRSVNVRDISENYTDTELRLKSKRAVLGQYLKLLDRADEMEDVLKIEKEIRLIREEIEAKEGTLRYLNNQVTFSTLYLEMYEEILNSEAPPAENFWRKAGNSLVFGWELIKGTCLVIIAVWPLLVFATGVWIMVRVWKRRKAQGI